MMHERRMRCPECGQLQPVDAAGRLETHLRPGPQVRGDDGRVVCCLGSRRPMVEVQPRGPVGGSPAWRPGDKKGGRR